MSTQDASDIVQMNSLSGEIPVASGGKKKSKLLWIVLGCVVVGVGLGVFVYQQSLAPAPKPSATPRASRPPASVAPVPSPVVPDTNQVGPVANTMTFPKKGKIRIFHTFNNIQAVAQLTIGGTKRQITLPAKPLSPSVPMQYADSSFEVEAGSTGTLELFLNSTSGPKLRGWMNPFDAQKKECGVQGGSTSNNESELYYATQLLAGETFFAYQCWEDDDVPGEFNDLYMIWTYAPGTATVSPSPAAGASASPSPSASTSAGQSASPSPSASVKASASPSPSVKASTAATVTSPTPTPSTRAAMPDTSEGVPVTGVFEVTVGTVSVGLLLLVVGLFGLLSL